MKKIKDKYSHLEPRSRRYYFRHKGEMKEKRKDWDRSFANTEYYLSQIK